MTYEKYFQNVYVTTKGIDHRHNKRMVIKSLKEGILCTIRGKPIRCKNSGFTNDRMNIDYAENSIDQSKVLFAMYDEHKDARAFAACKKLGKNGLEIITICSSLKGGGRKILKSVEKYCRVHKIKYIFLEALNTAETFYLINHFKYIPNRYGRITPRLLIKNSKYDTKRNYCDGRPYYTYLAKLVKIIN